MCDLSWLEMTGKSNFEQYIYRYRETLLFCLPLVDIGACRSAKKKYICIGFVLTITLRCLVFILKFYCIFPPGQLISDEISEITRKYKKEFDTYITYSNQLSTKSASAQYDDSYLGYSVAVGDFNGDGEDGETLLCLPQNI